MKNAELVIVDDDEFIIELVSRLLQGDQCKVSGFTDQEDCLAYLLNVIPAFLFVDMRMPKMDGLEFITNLKNRDFSANTKIYLCSGVYPTNQVNTAMSAMGVEVIVKDDLCNKVWIRNKLGFCKD